LIIIVHRNAKKIQAIYDHRREQKFRQYRENENISANTNADNTGRVRL